MRSVDTRQVKRDSVSLHAMLKVGSDPQAPEHRIRVRNLSPAGLMAEGDVQVEQGLRVAVQLKNVGWVDGSVAWTQDNRFGIAFVDQVDSPQAWTE